MTNCIFKQIFFSCPVLLKFAWKFSWWHQLGGGADSAPPMKSMFPSIYRHVIHVITLFFHGDYDENVFFLIQSHQGGLERREWRPGGVQQVNLDVIFRRCDTSFNPIFLWQIRWKYFHNDLRPPGCPRTPRTTSWWSTTRKTYVSFMDVWYILYPYFFMANTMVMFFYWFKVPRVA